MQKIGDDGLSTGCRMKVYLLLREDDPKLRAMAQIQLLQDSLTPGHMRRFTLGTDEGFCDHVVHPVDVQNLPCPFVQTASCQLMLSAGGIGTENLDPPQLVWHPQQKRMTKKSVWSWSLIVCKCWLWWVIPEL